MAFACWIYKEEYYYGISMTDNQIVRIDPEKRKVEFLRRIDRESRDVFLLYYDGIEVGDDIWFIPFNAERIVIYHVKDNQIDYLDLPEYSDAEQKFISVKKKDNRLWLIPYAYPALVSVTLGSHDITLYKNYPEEMRNNKWYFYSAIVDRDKIIMTPGDFRFFVEFDCGTEEMQVRYAAEKNEMYVKTYGGDGRDFIMPRNLGDPVLKTEQGEIKPYMNLRENMDTITVAYDDDDAVVTVSKDGKKVIYIEKSSGNIRCLENIGEAVEYKYNMVFKYKEAYYFVSQLSEIILCVKEDKLEEIEISQDEEFELNALMYDIDAAREKTENTEIGKEIYRMIMQD